MNKKFLSAILFGALMVSSTGTFVSCKDYDDDIKDLQEQINSNKDAIAALQKLVGEGKWVTNISSIENGFSVTMSDGTTTSITGIKGADGKNGTEWTIGEDGFWYKDGEKTASQAVAKDGEDGKAGATAPSPKISADGFWVVYEWDADKGEFVEKTTEISAQGTGAYVVKKDGVYVLHIADETGAFQDVTLPATSDSFVAEALKDAVVVNFETATWDPNTTSAAYKALLKEFPAIADIKKGDLVKQGGNLPVIISPSSVDLTKGFSFSLQTLKGETPDIAVSNPTKGLPANIEEESYTIQTRSADADACFWTLKVEPALNENQTDYVDTNDKWASLVIENAKGSVVKTAFAYKVKADSKDGDNVTVNGQDNSNNIDATAEYAESIDLFAEDSKENTPVKLGNEYIGYYTIKATDALQVEKYGLSIEGSTLKIANMPADVTSIPVDLQVTALGLNGTAKSFTVKLKVNQSLVPAGKLSDQAKVLSLTAQKVRWDVESLKFNATMLDKLCQATKTVTLTREEKGVTYIAYNGTFNCYTAADATGASYKNIKNIGFDVTANLSAIDVKDGETVLMTGEQIMPKTYTITLTATDANGSQIYTATAKLDMSNPASVIKLADAFVEDGVLQVVGTVANDKVTYDLNGAMVYKTTEVSNISFKDNTHAKYMEETASIDETAFEYPNWIATDGKLSVNTWNNDLPATSNKQQLYKTREMLATFTLFGNTKNETTFPFSVIVKSPVYSDTPASVITMKDDKLTAVFGKTINVKDATSAVLAAGVKKGTAYDLFDSDGSKKTDSYNNYANPNTVKGTDLTYAANSNGVMVEIALNDMQAFGFDADAILNASNGDKKYYVITAKETSVTEYTNVMTLGDLWNSVKKFYKNPEYKGSTAITNGWIVDAEAVKTATAAEKATLTLFQTYAAKIAFEQVEDKYTTAALDVTTKGYLAETSYIELEEAGATEAAKYVTFSSGKYVDNKLTAVSITGKNLTEVDVPSGEATVKFNLVVVDKWGKIMKRPFSVKFTTK